MATVEFRYDPKNTAWFTANAAMVLKAGEPAYHDTTGLFKLGDGVTALSALSFLPIVSSSTPTLQQVLTAGQIATTTIETTGFIKTGGLATEFLKADGSVDSSTYLTTLGTAATSLTTTGSSGAATLIANVLNVPNYTLAGLGGTTLAAVNAQNLSVFAATTSSQLAGVISDETGSGALVFGTSPTFTTGITTPLINGTSGTLQIGTTDLVNIGNASTTNQRLVRIGQGSAIIDIGNASDAPSLAGIWMKSSATANNSTNFALAADSSGNTYLNTPINTAFFSFQLASIGVTTFRLNRLVFNPFASTIGSNVPFTFTTPSNTNQTLSTNIPNFQITGNNKQWATGNITNQYWNYLTANTASFVGASTMTNSYGLFVEAATAGTNATITNNYAAGFSGNILITGGSNRIYFTGGTNYFIESDGTLRLKAAFEIFFDVGVFGAVIRTTNTLWQNRDGLNFQYGTTTGSKIGTATTQKLSFWNATPIVQPTTAVAAATFVANAGTAVNDASTFDGYTLQQIVKALRNTGLLA